MIVWTLTKCLLTLVAAGTRHVNNRIYQRRAPLLHVQQTCRSLSFPCGICFEARFIPKKLIRKFADKTRRGYVNLTGIVECLNRARLARTRLAASKEMWKNLIFRSRLKKCLTESNMDCLCRCPPLYTISTYASASVLSGLIFYMLLVYFYDFDELLPECQKNNVRDSLRKRAYVFMMAIIISAITLSILRLVL